MPFESETAPRDKDRKIEIESNAVAKPVGGLKTKKPTTPVTARITSEKITVKKYLALIKLRAEMGDEKIRHTA